MSKSRVTGFLVLSTVFLAFVGVRSAQCEEERWGDFVFGAPAGWEQSHLDFPTGVKTRVYALHSEDGDWISVGLIDARLVALSLSEHKVSTLVDSYFDAFFTARDMLHTGSQARSCSMDVEESVEIYGLRHTATGANGEQTLYSCTGWDRRNGRLIVVLGWSDGDRTDASLFDLLANFSKSVGFVREESP